jgi:hypothetical protein
MSAFIRKVEVDQNFTNHIKWTMASPDHHHYSFSFRSDVGHMFALSWLITWFAHVVNDPDAIFRIFDFFLGTHPLMPIYLGAAVSRNHVSERKSSNENGYIIGY